MAKNMLANLNAIVANTLNESIQMIDIDELHSSPDNFFEVERIEEFADTILGQGGVKDNLVVRPLESGGYEIISGHRRRAAVQLLIDRGENVSHYLPCLVQEYTDDDDRMLDLILMNVSARRLSDPELWKSYEVVDTILKKKKDAGKKFGRIREALAEILGVSPAQVGKMQNVEKNAIEEVKAAVENGEISISTANEIAKLDEDEQEQLVQGDLGSIKHKDVKKRNTKADTSDAENEEKVDTYINFSETDEQEEDEDEEDEPEEVDTYINEQVDEQEKDQSEESDGDEIPMPAEVRLSRFISESRFDIDEVLELCEDMTEFEDYSEVISSLKSLVKEVYEENRRTVRF